jgi:hypothetical protein
MTARATIGTKGRMGKWFALLLAIIAGPALATDPAPESCTTAGGSNTFDARAYSISMHSTLGGQQVNAGPSPDTGYLQKEGGFRDATALSLDAPPPPLLVTSYLLHNTVMGSGDTSTAKSTVLQLKLALYSDSSGPSGSSGSSDASKVLEVNADVISATATKKCQDGHRVIDQSQTGTSLLYLTVEIGGQLIEVPVNPDANTTIPIGPADPVISGTLILNEQFDDASSRHEVNGLHLTLQLAGGNSVDLIISHAEAGITCGSAGNACTCPVKDYVTGAGSIRLPNGQEGTFGLAGALLANGVQGQFNYVDHGSGTQITGNMLQSYSGSPPSTQRELVYACTKDNTAVDGGCDLKVSDNGEPGDGVDGFSLTSSQYSADGPFLEQGDIQVFHPACGDTTGGSSGGTSSGGSSSGGSSSGGITGGGTNSSGTGGSGTSGTDTSSNKPDMAANGGANGAGALLVLLLATCMRRARKRQLHDDR